MANAGYALDWNSPIEKDGPEFVTLQDGDYDFEIIDFERGQYPGGDKLPPCPKATVHVKIETPEGMTIIKHSLFLHSITEGLLCEFFAGIGQRQKGQRVNMDWNRVIGSKGKCKVIMRKYKDKEGNMRDTNDIKKFYEAGSVNPPLFKPGEF